MISKKNSYFSEYCFCIGNSADPDGMLCCIGISSRSSLFAFHRGLYFLLAFRSTMKMALFLFFPTIIITGNLCVNVTYDPCPGPLYVKKTLFV